MRITEDQTNLSKKYYPYALKRKMSVHVKLVEFEFRPDPATDYLVSCPWASKSLKHKCIQIFLIAFDSTHFKIWGGDKDRWFKFDSEWPSLEVCNIRCDQTLH